MVNATGEFGICSQADNSNGWKWNCRHATLHAMEEEDCCVGTCRHIHGPGEKYKPCWCSPVEVEKYPD